MSFQVDSKEATFQKFCEFISKKMDFPLFLNFPSFDYQIKQMLKKDKNVKGFEREILYELFERIAPDYMIIFEREEVERPAVEYFTKYLLPLYM
jgi:hypothetical protein